MRSLLPATILSLLLLAATVPGAVAQAVPASCPAGAAAPGEGERYATRTLWFHTTGIVADVDAMTGGEARMDRSRPLDGQSAYDLMVDSIDAPIGDPTAATWRYAPPAPERIVCWQVTWADIGGQPAQVRLWADPADAGADAAATATIAGGAARSQRTTGPREVDRDVTGELVVQIGAAAGIVEFDSINAASSLSYVVIEAVPPPPDVLVIDVDFAPRVLVVDPGATVTWGWQGTVPHDVRDDACTAGAGSCRFDSGILTATPDLGTRFSHTFTEPGSYPYHCSIHSRPGGTAHNGTIIVR